MAQAFELVAVRADGEAYEIGHVCGVDVCVMCDRGRQKKATKQLPFLPHDHDHAPTPATKHYQCHYGLAYTQSVLRSPFPMFGRRTHLLVPAGLAVPRTTHPLESIVPHSQHTQSQYCRCQGRCAEADGSGPSLAFENRGSTSSTEPVSPIRITAVINCKNFL